MSFIVNFHGIGQCKRRFEPGEEPYWISEDQFEAVLDLIGEAEFDGRIALTFDDGNDSDYEIALPHLKARKIPAMFFVLAGKIDQRGYLTSGQVQSIDSSAGYVIGSHGMDHRAWPDLNDRELDYELAQSRQHLSRICGRDIKIAGLPFGRYNKRILRALSRHGYVNCYSSDGGPRLRSTVPVPRFSIRSDVGADQLRETIRRSVDWLSLTRSELRAIYKAAI